MEKAKRYSKLLVVAFVMMFLVLIAFASYIQNNKPKVLYPQEIREYQGEDLSSVSDFRENSIKGPQYVNASTYRLEITGLVNKTVSYTYDQVLSMFQKYEKVVTLHCVERWSVKILWEGFLVNDLLKEAGVSPNATAAIFYAYDGYSTSLPLDFITSNNIIIAYKMNGITLPPERGFPFQLVAESQYGYKWIKWITKIELTDNADYLGYWESRGFPNNATLPNFP
jgi:DMSO/TMAO reductase YedYZ molybdopterin-dependent catalytic subunit